MKKIISLGVASAVCALTAISASAAAAYWDNAKGETMKGKQITVDIIANADVKEVSFYVAGTGVTIDKVENPTAGLMMNGLNDAKTKFTVSGGDKVVAKAGEVLCTVTATITGEAASTAKIEVTPAEADFASLIPETAYSFEVKGATDPGTTSSTTPSGTTSSTTPSGTTSSTTSGTTSTTTPGTNPGTGVALAVVPAVLAAAGVIVAKKRK